MVKKKERSVNVSGKPKHSLDVNRDGNASKGGGRTSATVRRLKMYNTRPKRNSKGHILSHDLQSKELPSTRIQPDRRWFGTFYSIVLIFYAYYCSFFFMKLVHLNLFYVIIKVLSYR